MIQNNSITHYGLIPEASKLNAQHIQAQLHNVT